MTTVAVLVRPPEPGTALPNPVDAGAVTASEAVDLYTAMVRDVCAAVEASGGDLLVNYRPVAADDPTVRVRTEPGSKNKPSRRVRYCYRRHV